MTWVLVLLTWVPTFLVLQLQTFCPLSSQKASTLSWQALHRVPIFGASTSDILRIFLPKSIYIGVPRLLIFCRQVQNLHFFICQSLPRFQEIQQKSAEIWIWKFEYYSIRGATVIREVVGLNRWWNAWHLNLFHALFNLFLRLGNMIIKQSARRPAEPRISNYHVCWQ